jgi:trigger factor
VELFDISAIHIPASVHTIDPAKVESAIISYLRETAPYERITDRPLADGDIFNIDHVATVDGVEIDRGSNTINLNYSWFIDGVLEQMLGHTPGETFDVKSTYSEDLEYYVWGFELYHGKDIMSTETINYIYQQIEPPLTELTDAYIFENYFTINNWYSVAQMRAEFENYFKSDSISDYIIDELIANTPVSSMPATFAQYQTNAQILKESLVVQAIAEKADIVITSDEMVTLFDRYYYDAYCKIDWHGTEPYKKQQLLKYKVIDYLKEHAIYE